MRKFLHFPAVLALLAGFGISTANAAAVSYTSLAAFQAAVINSGTDTFSDLNNGADLGNVALSRNAGAYSYSASASLGLFAGAEPNGFLTTNVTTDALEITAPAGITAIGGNFFGSSVDGLFVNGRSMNIFINGVPITTLTNTDPNSFFGYVSDTPITSLSVQAVQGLVAVWPSIDNLIFAQARPDDGNPVPEPGVLALLGLAVLAAGASTRRRQA